MLAAQARSPASVQSTKASQWTPITSVWMPSTSTAASAAAEPRRPGQQPPQQREVPREEEEHADEPQLDPELGVRRLAGLDLGAGSLRGHAGVPEPVAPRVAKNRLDPVPEVVQVAVDRGLAGAERIAARLLLLAAGALDLELGRGEARLRRDVRIGPDEEERGRHEHAGGGDRPPAPQRVGEHDESEDECSDRRPRVREEQRDEQQPAQSREPARALPRRRDEDRDQQQVGRRERAEEGRDETAERPLVAGVVDEVLREAGEATVVEPELLLEPAGHARVAPELQRDGVDVDEPPEGDGGRRGEDECRDPAQLGAVEVRLRPRTYAATGVSACRAPKTMPRAEASPPSQSCGMSA